MFGGSSFGIAIGKLIILYFLPYILERQLGQKAVCPQLVTKRAYDSIDGDAGSISIVLPLRKCATA